MISPEGKKVVYWIGAGASANALPIVGEMPAAFRNQKIWIEPLIPHGISELTKNRYFQFLATLATHAERYGTVDTYARALFLQGHVHELAAVKLHLAMFFMLEQVVEAKLIPNGKPGDPRYTRTSAVDTRYMSWLALLLEADRRLTERVQVISWNYDLQVEHALGRYLNLDELSRLHGQENIYVHPNPQKEVLANRKPFLIHLNGIAGQADGKSDRGCLYNKLQGRTPDEFVTQLFMHYDENYQRDQGLIMSLAESFTFAWEGKKVATDGIELAKEAMAEAEILVIIGYSFPSFNRAIDKAIYEAFDGRTGDKHVILQSRSIKPDTFKQMIGQSGKYPIIRPEEDMLQFHIPSELF